jgi:hypothetical protein
VILAHAVVLDASDIRCLKPMAEAAKKALQVVADAGYSNVSRRPNAKLQA